MAMKNYGLCCNVIKNEQEKPNYMLLNMSEEFSIQLFEDKYTETQIKTQIILNQFIVPNYHHRKWQHLSL